MNIINRKAYYNYSVIDEYTAGIVLTGSEVKSIRESKVTLTDSYVYIKDNEVYIKNMNVSKYSQIHNMEVHDPNRDKKLLLNRKEISRLDRGLQDKGTTIIPLKIFTSNNKIKILIGICKGKKNWDKKETIKERDIKRDINRELNI
jgi:SsrA-binding protein